MEKWEIPTRTENNGEAILSDVTESAMAHLKSHAIATADCIGFGMGIPGSVLKGGIVNRCVNLGWGVFSMPEAMKKYTDLPVAVGNDANVAALGEYYAGDKHCDSMLLATLGTGVGSGIILNGKILMGAHGGAGEIGHLPFAEQETEQCSCGKYGCSEQYGSAQGILRIARRYLERHSEDSPLRHETYDCKRIFDLAAQGDRAAWEIREEYFYVVGRLMAMACGVVDPELVVLGGGVSKAGPVLLEGVKRYFDQTSFLAHADTRFALATLGSDAGIYGGFHLIRNA